MAQRKRGAQVSSKKTLSQTDVARLLQDPSAANRADAAAKVAAAFSGGDMGDKERAIAEDIFHAMMQDVEVRVRQALALTLADAAVPRDVALKIANDVAEVAVPFIEATKALDDDDLIQIITNQTADHQVAIARRKTVSGKVADALVETRNEDVVATLVANDGADLSPTTMNRVLDTFGHVKRVATPMAKRPALPLDVAERLVTLVSDKIQKQLLETHGISSDLTAELVLQTRERATVSLLDGSAEAPDVHALVDQLHKNGRLTPTIVVRALCMGDLTFFETALARRAGITITNACKLIYEHGEDGLARLFDRADMPANMLEISRVALETAEDMTLNSRDDRNRFREVMLERVLTRCENQVDNDNLDYFISKLGKLAAAQVPTASA
ncbi:MAG: DUF2336 domain-containing protein [Alphaproteobacteria bacterium]|nr:MAG: DUF2336 domain-containing protein [Alphaproteobacteria bacterium]